MLRDLGRSPLPDRIDATLAVIVALRADVLLLTGVDADHGGAALDRLAEALAARGAAYPHRLVPVTNRGVPSGHDLDGDGTPGGPGDAQGHGGFRGAGGLALLSRLPILSTGMRDFSALLWRDLPGATMPQTPGGAPFPSAAAQAEQRLSSGGHSEVPLALPGGGTLRLLLAHASPPVFDGPEDRNGLRNRDELRFWQLFLGGWAPDGGPGGRAPFVLLGRLNLDPQDGDGHRPAIRSLLDDPRLRDPRPRRARVPAPQGVNARHRGDPALDTAALDPAGPGDLRLDYVLPSADLAIMGAGVLWPAAGQPLADRVEAAGGGRPVWVDLDLGVPAR